MSSCEMGNELQAHFHRLKFSLDFLRMHKFGGPRREDGHRPEKWVMFRPDREVKNFNGFLKRNFHFSNEDRSKVSVLADETEASE